MKIRDLREGQTARVTGYAPTDKAYRQKLLQMGLLKGASFTLVRRAPLGDPVEIRLNGFSLSLRQAEADALDLELVGECAGGPRHRARWGRLRGNGW